MDPLLEKLNTIRFIVQSLDVTWAEWKKESEERRCLVDLPPLDDPRNNGEFFDKVEADIEAGRLVIVVVDGDIGQTTETEFKEAEEQGRARLATDDEIAEHRERVQVLLGLMESTRPSSPLPS